MIIRQSLPVVRPRAHSVNLLEYRDGKVLVTWFAGTSEGAEDQVGVGQHFDPVRSEWGEPFIMTRAFDYGGDRWLTEQICPIENASGETIVYTWAAPFSTFRLHQDGVRWTRRISDNRPFRFRWSDGKVCDLECLSGQLGLTEQGIVFQGRPLLRNPAAGLAGGWLFPYHTERQPLMFHSRFLLLKGDGMTVEPNETDLYHPPGCLEPALAHLDSERWLCYMRYGQRGDGYVWRSESGDGGRTFTNPVLTNLRNPHSAIDIAYDPERQQLLIAYNDSHGQRIPLTLGVSEDEGQTFYTRDVEVTGDAAGFSYPKLYQGPDKRWHLFYTHQRTHIEHVEFDVDWLLSGRKEIGLR